MVKKKLSSSFAIAFVVILLLTSSLGYTNATAVNTSEQKPVFQENLTPNSIENVPYPISSKPLINPDSIDNKYEQNNIQVSIGATSVDNNPQPIPNPPLLSDYESRFLGFFGQNLSTTELNCIKLQWAQQNLHNQEVIKDTNGAVLNFSPLDSLDGCYLANIGFTSPYESYGYIENSYNMIGQIDYNFVYLLTDGWNEHYDSSAMGGESFVGGWMQTYYSGNIYIFAEPGPATGSNPPWENIVMVSGSNDINTPYMEWTHIGNAIVNNPEHAAWYFVGNTNQQFSCIAVFCYTPERWPNDYTPPHYWPDFFNSVEIDSVYATVSGQCRLTISTDGGATDPSPGNYYIDYDTQTQVTASSNDENYVFNYWTIDGSVSTDNPITVTATESQQFLQAHFTYTGPVLLTVDARDGILGYPLNPDIYIDGDYAGTGYASVQVPQGQHSVWMDESTWNGYWMCWSYLSYYSDYYGNGDYRPIYSDTYIYGVYY